LPSSPEEQKRKRKEKKEKGVEEQEAEEEEGKKINYIYAIIIRDCVSIPFLRLKFNSGGTYFNLIQDSNRVSTCLFSLNVLP